MLIILRSTMNRMSLRRGASGSRPTARRKSNLSTFLRDLNDSQIRAVLHPPDIPLQILAGPGTGKTTVLTARIAFLISHHKILPHRICALAFSNKAADDMRIRLTELLGERSARLIKIGTIHSFCAAYLRKYAAYVRLNASWAICDEEESRRRIKALLQPHKELLKSHNIKTNSIDISQAVSSLKERCTSLEEVARCLDNAIRLANLDENTGTESRRRILGSVKAEVHREYDTKLQSANLLDFSDLILYAAKLFASNQSFGLWCQHLVVDEFQDTDNAQYELMRQLVTMNRCITVAGDPDQAIYGWRSANVKNFRKMEKDFPLTQRVHLDKNYRSTGSILATSRAIISQDKTRISTDVIAVKPWGFTPVLLSFAHPKDELQFLVSEIQRLREASNGMLRFRDFAVLVRTKMQRDFVEHMLQKELIPNRVNKGFGFFGRQEVKILLAYLELVENESDEDAFSTAVQHPARGIGSATISKICSVAQRCRRSVLQIAEHNSSAQAAEELETITMHQPARRGLAEFTSIIQNLRKMKREGCSVFRMLSYLKVELHFEEYLQRNYEDDWQRRVRHVEGLMVYAQDLEAKIANEQLTGSPLQYFLHTCKLGNDAKTSEDQDDFDSVIISTCHAAKGLEWPVVMIPFVTQSSYPGIFNKKEERRVLYVACTRAKALLYLTFSSTPSADSEDGDTVYKCSEFLSDVISNESLHTTQVPSITGIDLSALANILERTPP
ncbi:nucleoside triphosphate hydrolase protein [Wolfiporia cocos MD-104 SS10]|uniref:DNA 3'-5' helicase n=1 Tax=Wolfiporia cocos (strain MD-104) TaxID=742152 RepID=A0A2H3JKY4_WOLCO|nr:nucleoside triphosphate hydrolase protein [Wolfiporia cocos MD-104 SS10]